MVRVVERDRGHLDGKRLVTLVLVADIDDDRPRVVDERDELADLHRLEALGAARHEREPGELGARDASERTGRLLGLRDGRRQHVNG